MLEIQGRLKNGDGVLTKNPYNNQITTHGVLSIWAQYTDEDEKLKTYLAARIN